MIRMTAAIALAITLTTHAHAGFWDNYYAACPSCLSGDSDPGPARIACGPMGLGSYGSCRMGIIGAIDQQAHGRCIVDPRSYATRCER